MTNIGWVFGDVVENLTFNSCLINKSEFLRIIRMCPNLQSLQIVRCDDIYKTWTVVKKLKSIKMKHEFNLNSLVIQETSSISREIFVILWSLHFLILLL